MLENIRSTFAWYALTVKPRHEKAVSAALRVRGYEEFLPLWRSRRVWSDRIKEIDIPLFNGYVFCRFGDDCRVAILRMPSVTSIVGFGNQPAPVDDREMESLKAIVASGLPMAPWPFLKVGQRIRIGHGPLTGVEGIVLELKKGWRVVVSISLLQRSVAVEVDSSSVAPSAGHAAGRQHRPRAVLDSL